MQADLDFLATPLRDVEARHSSLRAVFEHSWCLLSPTDQSALARLSIFCNPFRHAAARAVAEVTPPQLAAFVRKSWLHLAPDERYELHPLLRQFLAEKLAAHPADEHATRARHAAHFANVMMQMHQREQAGRTDQAQAIVKLVIDDVIAAFQWAVAQRTFEIIDQMIPYGYRYFAVAGQYQIGKTLFASAVEELRETRDADDRATMILAKLLGYTGVLKMFLVEYAEAQAHLETSLALARRLGAHAQASLALHSLGFIATEQGHHSQAKQLLEEALVLRRQNSGDTVPILATLGRLALETGAPAQARVRYDAAVALAPTGRTPLTPNIAIALHGLGRAYQRLGEPDQARRVLEQSLGMCRALEHKLGTARCLADLGRLATDAGDFATATAHLAASVRLLREIGKTNEAALALREQGWLSEAQNDYIAARHAYAASEEWLAQMPNQLYSAVVHADLGRVCAWLNDFRAAETFLASARALAEETQSTYGAMLAHASWGIVARGRGAWQEAREHLRAALRISVDAQEVYEALKTLVELADTLAQMGACERAATLSAFALAHPATPQHYKARAQAIVARVPEPSTRVQTLAEIVTLVNQDPQGL